MIVERRFRAWRIVMVIFGEDMRDAESTLYNADGGRYVGEDTLGSPPCHEMWSCEIALHCRCRCRMLLDMNVMSEKIDTGHMCVLLPCCGVVSAGTGGQAS